MRHRGLCRSRGAQYWWRAARPLLRCVSRAQAGREKRWEGNKGFELARWSGARYGSEHNMALQQTARGIDR